MCDSLFLVFPSPGEGVDKGLGFAIDGALESAASC
jgi:hypothetical protein